MAAPSVANSQTFTYAGTATESHYSSTEFYSTIVVQNDTAEPIFVAIDGGTATAGGNNEEQVEAGQTFEFDNEQRLPNESVKPNNSQGVPNTSTYADVSTIPGWTAQQGYIGTSPTYVSVIPLASATGDVTVSFQ